MLMTRRLVGKLFQTVGALLTCYLYQKCASDVLLTRLLKKNVVDSSDLALLTLLDITVAFNTVDHLRSSATDTLLVPQTRLVTFGDQVFPVAAAKLWNEFLGDHCFHFSDCFSLSAENFLFHVS